MATLVKLSSRCDIRTKNIVNGYIRKIQKLFPWQDNSYFIIPQLINHICLSFYWIKFSFNRKYFGKNLQFINDTTVTKDGVSNSHSLCVMKDSISSELCDIFQMECKIKNVDAKELYCCYIGFLYLKSIDKASDISWNDCPGYGIKNNKISAGICLWNHFNRDYLFLYKGQGRYNNDSISLKHGQILKQNDAVMVEFDFRKAECCLYHNGIKLDYVMKLNGTHIIPCLSLYYKGDVVEITKYEFINVDK